MSDAVLLEDINYKLDAILEGQAAMAGVPAKLNDVDERLTRVEGDVKTIKAVVTAQSLDLRRHDTALHDHETRLSDLENAG